MCEVQMRSNLLNLNFPFDDYLTMEAAQYIRLLLRYKYTQILLNSLRSLQRL